MEFRIFQQSEVSKAMVHLKLSNDVGKFLIYCKNLFKTFDSTGNPDDINLINHMANAATFFDWNEPNEASIAQFYSLLFMRILSKESDLPPKKELLLFPEFNMLKTVEKIKNAKKKGIRPDLLIGYRKKDWYNLKNFSECPRIIIEFKKKNNRQITNKFTSTCWHLIRPNT